MCWPHVFRNVLPRLEPIKHKKLDLFNYILHDIEELQWSVFNETIFKKVYDLLEKKMLIDIWRRMINMWLKTSSFTFGDSGWILLFSVGGRVPIHGEYQTIKE